MDKRSWLDYYGVRFPDLNSNPQYIAAVVERALGTILAASFKNDPSNYDLYTKSFPGIDVQRDAYDTYFSTVPVRIIQLPDSAESVRRITATNDQFSIEFIPVPKDSWSEFALLDISKVSSLVPYTITNNRVEYMKKPPVTLVTMDIVRAFMDMEDSEEVSIPAGHEHEFEQLVATMLTGTPPPNKVNV